jgi:hypothetical protein
MQAHVVRPVRVGVDQRDAVVRQARVERGAEAGDVDAGR